MQEREESASSRFCGGAKWVGNWVGFARVVSQLRLETDAGVRTNVRYARLRVDQGT
jgi:hypothetical protein